MGHYKKLREMEINRAPAVRTIVDQHDAYSPCPVYVDCRRDKEKEEKKVKDYSNSSR